MPTFWRQRGRIYITTFTKILVRVASDLKDLGLDSAEGEDVLIEKLLDTEGIDSMASAILTGVLGWDVADPKSQYWYCDLTEIVQLLRRAETLLPKSWALVNSADLRSLVPDRENATTILTMVDDDIDIPPTQEDNISLRSVIDLEALEELVEELRPGSSAPQTFPWTYRTGRRFFGVPRLPKQNKSASARKLQVPKWLPQSFSRASNTTGTSSEAPLQSSQGPPTLAGSADGTAFPSGALPELSASLPSSPIMTSPEQLPQPVVTESTDLSLLGGISIIETLVDSPGASNSRPGALPELSASLPSSPTTTSPEQLPQPVVTESTDLLLLGGVSITEALVDPPRHQQFSARSFARAICEPALKPHCDEPRTAAAACGRRVDRPVVGGRCVDHRGSGGPPRHQQFSARSFARAICEPALKPHCDEPRTAAAACGRRVDRPVVAGRCVDHRGSGGFSGRNRFPVWGFARAICEPALKPHYDEPQTAAAARGHRVDRPVVTGWRIDHQGSGGSARRQQFPARSFARAVC
ncbi:hypothetical protein FB451DRAFT_101874 [Mycena latifolia]|nr:hypothetical protein FB451DRAFT_101874 [Mycena latifolia]